MAEDYDTYKRWLRFFSTRMVQALIQSRLGDEVESKCASHNENVWFNTRIDELGEISAYLKSNIKNYPPLGTLTLEFLLFTPSGQCLPLEAWILSASEGNSSNSQGECSRNELYHDMSTLLRSAIVSSRMTPMHRLYVKKQNLETFVITYRVFENDTSSDMGKGRKTRKIGELVSKFGNISLDLHYRTSMHFEEPEIAPITPIEDEIENESSEKASVEEQFQTRAASECVPIQDAKKQRKASGSVESATSGGSSISREAAPRFILGQSTSSEDSRHSECQNSYEEDHKPSLADLRNHSFPFVNLLQSAYNPSNGSKKNASSTCLNSPRPSEDGSIEPPPPQTPTNIEKISESFRTAKIDKVVFEEDEDEEEAVPQDSMELSEDSFVHFNQLSEFGGSPSIGNELGDLLKSLKTAPELLESGDIDICKMDFGTELEKIRTQTEHFNHFLKHVNSFSDE